MTPPKLVLAALAAVAVSSTTAHARPRPAGHLGGQAFEANKTFGLGLELGAPFGLNGKWFFAPDRALDFGIGDVYTYGNRNGFHLYGDLLFHPTSLAHNEAFELPFYVGIGGRFWSFNDDSRLGPNDATAFGVRVPLGLSFDFNNIPLDAFVQVVPTLDFFSGNAAHSVFVDVDFSVGVRYWFN
jgi:hypothetical protein